MYWTNGTTCGAGKDEGEVRKFRIIQYDGLFVWVEAMNGNYTGERLTFRRCDLKEVK
jgi:hypothetical protein